MVEPQRIRTMLTITILPNTTQDNLNHHWVWLTILITSDHQNNTVTASTLTSLVLINMLIKLRHIKMLRLDRLVTTVSCAVISIPHVLNVHLSMRRKVSAQVTLSVSWRTRRLNVVHARNSERDVLNVTWQLDVQLVFQDIGKWVEIASRDRKSVV